MKCVKSKLGSDDSWKLFAVCVIGTAASIHRQYDAKFHNYAPGLLTILFTA